MIFAEEKLGSAKIRVDFAENRPSRRVTLLNRAVRDRGGGAPGKKQPPAARRPRYIYNIHTHNSYNTRLAVFFICYSLFPFTSLDSSHRVDRIPACLGVFECIEVIQVIQNRML